MKIAIQTLFLSTLTSIYGDLMTVSFNFFQVIFSIIIIILLLFKVPRCRRFFIEYSFTEINE